jgi:hypothetical protein
MRRIQWSLAVLAAIATACADGPGAEAASGTAQGVVGQYYYVNLFTPPMGGVITSDVGGINCGAASVALDGQTPPQYVYAWYGTAPARTDRCGQFRLDWAQPITLTATPQGTNVFIGWAGDCTGSAATCTLTAGPDKSVVAIFGAAGSGHGNFTDPALHGPAALAYAAGTAGALQCNTCHGANLEGQSIAPACAACHAGKAHLKLTSLAFQTGPAVTAACLRCHAAKGDQLLASNHFTWLGSSNLVGHTTPASIGKRNVINNFCVANASNESRCLQCHPSYGSPPVKNPVTGAVTVNTGPMYLWSTSAGLDKSRIDCLICHGNLATSRYMKSPAGFGQPWISTSASCFPSCSAAQVCSTVDSTGAAWTDGVAHCRAPNSTTEVVPALRAAADSIGTAQRANCGFCHFNAGGGDNVKMGDLGTALKSPTRDVDVHMGSAASYAPRVCADCHQSGSHSVRGAGLSIPVDNEGRFTCTDCHNGPHAPAHADAQYTAHADFMACQTCHIPAFSRTQFTKMNWDWQTAADKQACQGLAGCVVFNSLAYPAGNAQTGTISGVGGEAPKAAASWPTITAAAIEQGYDWKKGVSTYARGVVPSYRFVAPASQQQGTHETTARDGLLGLGTPDDPYRLADLLPPPAPVLAGWRIAPFKRMTGRTPAFADGSAMVVPHVFGADSLWQNDLRGYPVVANTLGSAGNPWTQAKADAIWTGVNNYGAAIGGQLGAPVARVSAGQMTRDASNLVTVNTLADLPAPFPASLYLVGAEAAFPTGVKAVTQTGPRQFTYAETIPYTTNPSASPPITLPPLPAASTAFVAFYAELRAADWRWANTVMFINLNHEVAPKASALTCSACHPSLGGTIDGSRMKELYDLRVGGCEDPMACRKR